MNKIKDECDIHFNCPFPIIIPTRKYLHKTDVVHHDSACEVKQ